MQGCSNSTKPSEVQKVKVSEALLVPCQGAEMLESDTMQELASKYLANSTRLNRCVAKNNALIEQIREIEK